MKISVVTHMILMISVTEMTSIGSCVSSHENLDNGQTTPGSRYNFNIQSKHQNIHNFSNFN